MSFFQLCFGLLAFVLALYTLAARDQRSPYLTTTAYNITFFVIAAAGLHWLGSALVDTASGPYELWRKPTTAADVLVLASYVALVVAVAATLHTTLLLRNRRINLRTDYLRLSSFKWIREVRAAWRRMKGKKQYADSPEHWPDRLRKFQVYRLNRLTEFQRYVRIQHASQCLEVRRSRSRLTRNQFVMLTSCWCLLRRRFCRKIA